jgi:glutathione S-transferase
MRNRLYSFPISPSGKAAQLALEHKGIPFELKNLPAGAHLYLTRVLGFEGSTVPALKLGDRRLQDSIEIARALEQLQPDPPLYPSDEEAAARVREAEEWGERELQPVVREVFRWGMATNRALMPLFVRDVQGLRPVRPLAALEHPIIKRVAAQTGGTEANARRHVAELDTRLDRVDALIAEGVIGGPQRNAADFQIGASTRIMLALADLEPFFEGRPAKAHALAIWPELDLSVPRFVPPEWLPEGSGTAAPAA